MRLKHYLTALLTLCTVLATTAMPKTYLWKTDNIASVKDAISKNSPIYKESYERLMRDANKELTKAEPTVVDKPMAPISGDKHDYMSLGRYWWPNPDTPDGLPYIRKDGLSNPELSKYDREKLGGLGTSVSKLTLAYLLSDKSDYARKAASLIRTWFLDPKTKMNPNMNFGQTIPGHNDGKGRAEGVIDTYSLVSVVDAISILSNSGYISDKELSSLRAWFKEYILWLTTSEIGLDEKNAANNHGLAYDVQLTIYALFCGDEELARQTIDQFAKTRLATQIQSDGKQPRELARTTGFGYSVFNLTHILDMCEIASSVGIDLFNSDNGSINRAIQYLIPFLGNQSSFPYQQIKDWRGVEENFAQALNRAAQYTDKDQYISLYQKYKAEGSKDYMYILRYECM